MFLSYESESDYARWVGMDPARLYVETATAPCFYERKEETVIAYRMVGVAAHFVH